MEEYRRIIIDNTHYYGKHLIASFKRCTQNITDKQAISDFLHQLAVDIDMKPFGQPIVERFGEGIEIGISGVQLIETSAITVHTNDMARDLYLDVFSCKDFDPDEVLRFVNDRFSPEDETYKVLLRS
ncbi:MAG: S-adenosylmethionine decarboxylase [Candidatus Hinthialibacter antarcticus]|nr:S-adenosylmethionine decarboxylase [Candidatus Hinthialibacter antarcticus]